MTRRLPRTDGAPQIRPRKEGMGTGCGTSHSVRSREGGKPPRSWAVAPPPRPSHAGGAVWAQRSQSRAAWSSGGSRPPCQAGSPYASYTWAPGAPGSAPEAAGGATAPAAQTASPSPPSCVQPPPKHREDHHRHRCCHQDRYRAGHIPATTTTAGATTTVVLRAPTVPLPRHLLQGLRAQDAGTGLILMSRETEAGFQIPGTLSPGGQGLQGFKGLTQRPRRLYSWAMGTTGLAGPASLLLQAAAWPSRGVGHKRSPGATPQPREASSHGPRLPPRGYRSLRGQEDPCRDLSERLQEASEPRGKTGASGT